MFSNLSLAQILVALVLVSLSLAAAQQSDVIIISTLVNTFVAIIIL